MRLRCIPLTSAGILLLATLLALPPTAAVEAATYPVVADTYAHGRKPGVNFGSAGLVVVRKFGPIIGFAKFDFPGIPAAVKQAELRLGIDTVKVAGVIELYIVMEPWEENTLTYENMPEFGTVALASIPVTPADTGTVLSVDVSGIVRNWVTGTTPNYGIALYSTSVNARLDSRETEEGIPMHLEVELKQASRPAGQLP